MDHNYAIPASISPKCLALLFEKPLVLKYIKSDLPIEKQVVHVLMKKRRHLKILKQKCKQHQDKIVSFLRGDADVLVNNIFKHISASIVDFILAHLKSAKRPPKNKTWTLYEQISSVTFLTKNPKSYTLLRRFLALPSPNSLSHLLSKIPFDIGINEHLFQHLAKSLDSFNRKERICCLGFGEINVREWIHYNSSLDVIDGIVDLGKTQGRRSSVASKVLVFMAQGVVRKWKQPIAYYFTHTDICSVELECIIREVIGSLFRVGVPVVATTCNVNTTNVNTLRMMGSSVFHPYFFHEDSKIYTIFNPSHLLLRTRDLLQKYPITFPFNEDGRDAIETARWEHIRKVHEFNQAQNPNFRVLRYIQDYHLRPVGPLKKKVSLAVQLLSRIMAAYTASFTDNPNSKVVSPDAIGTAHFLLMINNLFDSLNGRSSSEENYVKKYRVAVNRKSYHMKFWDETFECIQNWTFEGAKRPPLVQEGWLITISAVKGLWLALRKRGIQEFFTRVLSNDPLDNLFAAIRSGCGNNGNPTVQQFANSLKVQILNGLLCEKLHGTDCEEDDLVLLSNLQTLLNVEQVQNTTSIGTGTNISLDNSTHIVSEIVRAVFANNTKTLSVVNLSSIIARTILGKSNCSHCINMLTSEAPLACDTNIASQESSDNQSKQINPSEQFIITVGCGVTLVEQLLPNRLQDTELRKKLAITLSEQIDFSWVNCALHFSTVKKCTVEIVCCIGIPWYCKHRIHDTKKHRTVSRRNVQRKGRTVQH